MSDKTSRFFSWLVPIIIALTTFLVFSPVLQNDFVDWDDPDNLLENQKFRGITWSHLRWMFTTIDDTLYRPLTWVVWGFDYLVWGLDPWGYHFSSLLLHCANSVLFYFVSLRVLQLASKVDESSDLPLRLGAGFAALIFSLHPLRVEAVAWASALSDVLSVFFILSTVVCYFDYAAAPEGNATRRKRFAAGIVTYGLSLLAKGSGMSLPIVLLALDVYPLRRLGAGPAGWFGKDVRRVWFEKVPFLILAICAGALNLVAKYQGGAMVSMAGSDLPARLAQSLYGLVFYIWKTILPLELSPLYELPPGLSLLDAAAIRGGIIVLLISVLLFFARRRWPAVGVCWVCYCALLAPVLGIFQSGPQLAADRYSYLSCLGIAVLSGGGLIYAWRHCGVGTTIRRPIPALVSVLAMVILFALGFLTFKQTQFWRDSQTLWSHALAVNPSGLVHFHLGTALASTGQIDEGIEHLKAAAQIHTSHIIRYNLGKLLMQRGDLDEAGEHFRRAAEQSPNVSVVHSGLALVLAKQGKLDEATAHFRRALEIDPADARALNNLGITLAKQGKLEEAARHFRRAIELNPRDAGAHSNLARALLQSGDVDGATEHLSRAVELDPKDAEIHSDLALILSRKGELARANLHLRRTLEINPNDAGAHNNLAINSARLGNLDAAIDEFRQALRIAPDLADAHAGLARVLAAQGKTKEATTHYQEALRILRSQRVSAAKK